MCGIAGYYGIRSIDSKKISSTLGLMKQRGPDAKGYVKKKIGKKNLYFLHTRLSIIDLKKRSNQPYKFKKNLMVFNGEIYNYIELKEYLKKQGYNFSTSSDTEVLIKMYDNLGEKAFDKLEGMWSIALFDLKKKKLLLSRDRFGEKPLYYKITKDGLYFGSETKFIQSLFNKKLKPNLKKCIDYLMYGYNSFGYGNNSFINTIKPIEPSTNLSINKNNDLKKTIYWSLNNIKKNKENNTKKIVKEIREILIFSIKQRLRSDVKDGFFLSGGIDSGSVVSVSNKIFKKKINSFSIYQKDIKNYDESKIISKISKKFRYKKFYIDTKNIKIYSTLKEMISYYNSPVLTLNNLIQSCLYKLMKKKNIKVAFSGIGGDEIFAGYYDHFLYHLDDLKNTKFYFKNYLAWKNNVRKFIRNPKLKELKNVSIKNFSRFKYINNFNLLFKKKNKVVFKKQKLVQNSLLKTALLGQLKENLEPMLYVDDLNAMKYSIENRSPLLDRRLIEKVFSIDSRLLIQNGYNKYLMREATKGILDNKIRSNRQKIGFNCSIKSINGMGLNYMKKYIELNNVYINKFFRKNKLIQFLEKIDFRSLNSEDDKFIFRILSTVEFLKNNKKYV